MRRIVLIATALLLAGPALAHSSTIRELPSASIQLKGRGTASPTGRKEGQSEARRHHAKPAPHPAELVSINTHESFELVPGPDGSFGRKTMKGLARFLRCHHTQKMHAMSERLARLLYTTSNHFDFTPLEIVAGYRAPRIAKEKGNPKSPHKKGLACDFRVPGVTNETLRDYVRTFPKVGVGYYPNSGFVHLDVRDKVSAFWVDYSGPGERARYSPTPEEDIKRLATRPDSADQADQDGAIVAEPEVDPDEDRREGRVTKAEGRDPQVAEKPGVLSPNLPALAPTTPQNNE